MPFRQRIMGPIDPERNTADECASCRRVLASLSVLICQRNGMTARRRLRRAELWRRVALSQSAGWPGARLAEPQQKPSHRRRARSEAMHRHLVQRSLIVWRCRGKLFPHLRQRALKKGLVGGVVEDQQATVEWYVANQILELMDAAGVAGREAAQVHQDGLAALNEARQCRLPGIGMAEEVIDAEAAIRIARTVALGEAARERSLIAHEMAAELAAQEIEELVRLDGAECDIGAGDHLDAADVSPVSGHALKQRIAAAAEREHAQKCEVARHARRRAIEPADCRQYELEGDERHRRGHRPDEPAQE